MVTEPFVLHPLELMIEHLPYILTAEQEAF